MTILAVARNTFREHIRDKILYNLIAFALLMILSSVALGQLTLGHEQLMIVNLGLSAISIFGTLIAIFLGISLVYKELERRTVYALLAKPLTRHAFIIGKYLGLLLTLSVNVVIMLAGLALTLLYHGADVRGYWMLLPAVCLIFLSLALTTALALLFSTFSTPVLSAVFTFFLWVIGHFNRDLLQLGKWTESWTVARACEILYYVLPNMSNFKVIEGRNVIQSVAYFQPIEPAAVAWVSLYGIVYSAAVVCLALLIFSRRDFK